MRYTLMFELSSLGAVFTSYDVESRLLDNNLVSAMGLYANIALGLVIFFCIIEVKPSKECEALLGCGHLIAVSCIGGVSVGQAAGR